MQRKIDVSVIVGHYGHGKEVFKCLDNLKIIKDKFKSSEFILVDNNEGKLEKAIINKKYPWIKYIPAQKNLGWGGGRNLGIKNSSGEFILSLDSDVLIDYKSFRNLYQLLQKNKRFGIVIPRIKNISGRFTSEATKELNPLRGIFFLSFINKIFPGNFIVRDYLMREWDRETSGKVDVGQLGAFMIKERAYEKIGKFDENLFLYFEENDVSKGLKKNGYEIYFDSNSQVIHLESLGTPKSSDFIKKTYNHSRFYYFKKHYGIIPALLVEFFARISKKNLLLAGILIFGTFLRFYKLIPNLILNGEMGYDYMTIRTFVENHQIPLIGPRTSHEWFFIGPLFYWIFGVLLPLFHYNVAVGAYFFAIVGVASILVGYWVVRSFFGEKAGLISALLLSFSPLWVFLTRDARFNAMTALLFFPFYYLLVKSVKDHGKSLFILGLTLGIMFSFFPSPILLLPGSIIVIYIFRKQFDKKYFLPGILGLIIPNIPYLIYNATHKFEILINIFAWIPYRVLGFFGLYPKNTITTSVFWNNITGLYTFFQQSFLHSNNILIFILFLLVLIFAFTQFKKSRPLQILLILFGVSYFGLFLHGNPPQHYYLVVFPIPIIILGLFLEKLSQKYIWFFVLILGYLLFFNLKFYFSNDWFYVDSTKISQDMNFVPYSLQLKVADFIATDSGGKKFTIGRVGPLDYFGENFSLNYQYLLWGLNHKPEGSAKLKYTIYEDTSDLPQNQNVHWVENIAIIKNE